MHTSAPRRHPETATTTTNYARARARARGAVYAPVDPFKPSVALGVKKILGKTKDRTIDDIHVDRTRGERREEKGVATKPSNDHRYSTTHYQPTRPLRSTPPPQSWYSNNYRSAPAPTLVQWAEDHSRSQDAPDTTWAPQSWAQGWGHADNDTWGGRDAGDWGPPIQRRQGAGWDTPAPEGEQHDWGTRAPEREQHDWGIRAPEVEQHDWGIRVPEVEQHDWGTRVPEGEQHDWGTPFSEAKQHHWGSSYASGSGNTEGFGGGWGPSAIEGHTNVPSQPVQSKPAWRAVRKSKHPRREQGKAGGATSQAQEQTGLSGMVHPVRFSAGDSLGTIDEAASRWRTADEEDDGRRVANEPVFEHNSLGRAPSNPTQDDAAIMDSLLEKLSYGPGTRRRRRRRVRSANTRSHESPPQSPAPQTSRIPERSDTLPSVFDRFGDLSLQSRDRLKDANIPPADDDDLVLAEEPSGTSAKRCSRCNSTSTPLWRFDRTTDKPLCEACYRMPDRVKPPIPRVLQKRVRRPLPPLPPSGPRAMSPPASGDAPSNDLGGAFADDTEGTWLNDPPESGEDVLGVGIGLTKTSEGAANVQLETDSHKSQLTSVPLLFSAYVPDPILHPSNLTSDVSSGSQFVSPNESQPSRKTFVDLEPSETITKAFVPKGLLSSGLQDKQDRSEKHQEALARETGGFRASLSNVPNKPPPPQTGLLGTITVHERELKREGGVGSTLTEREREKRMAEERQRRLDEQQRQQMDQMHQASSMYGAPFGFNPMMSPMMMTGGGRMDPMMGGQPALNLMMTGGGMNPMMGYGMMPNFNLAAQQAAQAYHNAMMAFSVAGSQGGGDRGGSAAQQNPATMGQGNMGGMGGFDSCMSMNMMGMMGGMGGMNPQMGNPQMMGNPQAAQTTEVQDVNASLKMKERDAGRESREIRERDARLTEVRPRPVSQAVSEEAEDVEWGWLSSSEEKARIRGAGQPIPEKLYPAQAGVENVGLSGTAGPQGDTGKRRWLPDFMGKDSNSSRLTPNSTNVQYQVEPFRMPPPSEDGYLHPASPPPSNIRTNSSDPNRTENKVYVAHHDGNAAPVTIYHEDGTELVELPPRYQSMQQPPTQQASDTENIGSEGTTVVHEKFEPLRRPSNYPSEDPWVDDSQTSLDESDTTWIAITLSLFLDVVPRQVYLHLLLRFPALYFSRVTRIFQDANLGMGEIKRMALEAVESDLDVERGPCTSSEPSINRMLVYQGFFPQEHTGAPHSYINLRNSWQGFIDSLMREWKTLNIISVLLLSAILTILQIEAAAANPLTRFSALLSLVCAFMSLLYGCLYIIRFGTMRKTHKAAEWANESERSSTSIFWNVWVMLAMPAVWLGWSVALDFFKPSSYSDEHHMNRSMILYLVCVMSFVWQTGTVSDRVPASLLAGDLEVLVPRIIISAVLGLGFVYLVLIALTFRRYSDPMEVAWQERIRGWIAEKAAESSGCSPPCTNDVVDHKGQKPIVSMAKQDLAKGTTPPPAMASYGAASYADTKAATTKRGAPELDAQKSVEKPKPKTVEPTVAKGIQSHKKRLQRPDGDPGPPPITIQPPPPSNPPFHGARLSSKPAPLLKGAQLSAQESISVRSLSPPEEAAAPPPPHLPPSLWNPFTSLVQLPEHDLLEVTNNVEKHPGIKAATQPSKDEDHDESSPGLSMTILAKVPDDEVGSEAMEEVIRFDGMSIRPPHDPEDPLSGISHVPIPSRLLEGGMSNESWDSFCKEIDFCTTWPNSKVCVELVRCIERWNFRFSEFNTFAALIAIVPKQQSLAPEKTFSLTGYGVWFGSSQPPTINLNAPEGTALVHWHRPADDCITIPFLKSLPRIVIQPGPGLGRGRGGSGMAMC
ncbi:hypothetical protein D9611_010191 [Ephemerocybe angulata]|uniref:GATA-type domain-containing protein n=1 Tax=Ephemerocybe angulata TaxID=980116 RepID=A0A8H5AZM2_9AGAR|nr:hypothetical protein D9611_010191 [Tulosesus angulatus]